MPVIEYVPELSHPLIVNAVTMVNSRLCGSRRSITSLLLPLFVPPLLLRSVLMSSRDRWGGGDGV